MKPLKATLLSMVILPLFFSCTGNMGGATNNNNNQSDTTGVNRNSNTNTASATNSSSNTSNQQFVQEAAMDGMFEVQAGQIARDKSDNQKIKDLAEMIINDHQDANQKLKDIARNNNWNFPDNISDKHQDKLDQLRDQSGKDFNDLYVQTMVDAHQKAIDKFEREANTTDNQDLKNWVSNTLPTLRKHLDRAQAVQGNI